MMGRPDFSSLGRLTVKIGTSSLTDSASKLDERKVKKFVQDIMQVRKGREILIVTSGAIGAGMGRLGLKERPRRLDMLQAAAAVGQGILMQTYEKYFLTHGQSVAQLLLTGEDFTNPQRLENFKATLRTLLGWGVIPIINENDTVATEEIKIGDNDILAAYVAIHSASQLLVILSDVDGLFTEDPKNSSKARLVRVIEKSSSQLDDILRRAPKKFGGIYSKIVAARMVGDHGIPTLLANFAEKDVLGRILRGEEIGTLILPK
ncbi:MAG: glutamate 5-kinase [Candidatus Hadarchaeales archaeon]